VTEYLLMGDIHLRDRPPSACTDSYLDDILDLLRHVGTVATQRQCEAIIWAGDVFDCKTPGRTSHRTLIDTIDLLHAYPCPTYVVPGNHDMQHDRLDSIATTQPLGVLLASGALNLLHGWMGPTDKLDTHGWLDPVYGVPWLQDFTDDTVHRALDLYREDPGDLDHHLVVTHAPLYPAGRELPYENYPTTAWANAMNNHGSVFYGHVHEPHGVHTAAGVVFCNPGAISRGSLHEHNLHRPIQVAAWDSATGQFTLLDIPHKPADQVFRLNHVTQTRNAQATLNQFLDTIGQASIEITSIEAVMDHVRTLKLAPRVETTILTLLKEAE